MGIARAYLYSLFCCTVYWIFDLFSVEKGKSFFQNQIKMWVINF